MRDALQSHVPLVKLDKCVYVEIGHDGFQPFNNTPHRSTWGVWLKVKNVDPCVQFRYMNVRELALWPQAKRKRGDGYCDKIDITQAFEQIALELR